MSRSRARVVAPRRGVQISDRAGCRLSGEGSSLTRYGVAMAAAVAAVAVRYALWDVVGPEPTFLIAYPAVVVAAWTGGMGPGMLATALCMLAAGWLMRHTWGGEWTLAVGLRFALFAFSGMLISMLCGSLRMARQRAEAAL